MNSAKRIALAVLSLFALGASAPSAPTSVDTAADEAALRAADQTFMRAYYTGDLDTIVALYTDDAVLCQRTRRPRGAAKPSANISRRASAA